MERDQTYALLDCGAGRRLEAFGPLILDRPAPTANQARMDPTRWTGAIAYRAGRGWADADGMRPAEDAAGVRLAGVTMTAQLGPGGQVGIFPEHAGNAAWLRSAIVGRSAGADGAAPEVLNLFAHTGLLTLVAADVGARVVHVDSSRPSVQWARRNAALSELDTRPIRWLVDDGIALVQREARRGRRYAGIVLDPPSYGHGGSREGWQFAAGIDALLDACAAITEPDAFWILTTHTMGWDANRLAGTMVRALGREFGPIDAQPLNLVAESGAILHLGATARADPLRQETRS